MHGASTKFEEYTIKIMDFMGVQKNMRNMLLCAKEGLAPVSAVVEVPPRLSLNTYNLPFGAIYSTIYTKHNPKTIPDHKTVIKSKIKVMNRNEEVFNEIQYMCENVSSPWKCIFRIFL